MYSPFFLLALLTPLTFSAPTALSTRDIDSSLRKLSLDARQVLPIPAQHFDPQDSYDDLYLASRDADFDNLALVRKSWDLESFAGNEKAAKAAAAKSAKSVAGGAESVKRAAETMANETAAGAGMSVAGSVKRAVETTVDELATAVQDKVARWQEYCKDGDLPWVCKG